MVRKDVLVRFFGGLLEESRGLKHFPLVFFLFREPGGKQGSRGRTWFRLGVPAQRATSTNYICTIHRIHIHYFFVQKMHMFRIRHQKSRVPVNKVQKQHQLHPSQCPFQEILRYINRCAVQKCHSLIHLGISAHQHPVPSGLRRHRKRRKRWRPLKQRWWA